MKRILFLAAATILAVALGAKDAKDLRIYLNPGHGSWGPNDRPMATIPYPNLSSTGRPDTCGFYESNTNLWKVKYLGERLEANGFQRKNITYSRLANGPYPYVAGAADLEKYNRNLSEICEEVEAGNYDMFLSVHSNAASDGAIANYPLLLYRGYDDGSTAAEGSVDMCKAVWKHLWRNSIDYFTSYSETRTNIRGDIDFYHSSSTATRSNGKKYTGYLGVLKHGVPGMLSEGYFHTYQPARHRALNPDYCHQEGVRYLRGILEHFKLPGESVGYIMGTVKDANNQIEHNLYKYGSSSDDMWYPVNNAKVVLCKDDVPVDSYRVDNFYNGVFVFENLQPGKYTLRISQRNYESYDGSASPITVNANATAFATIKLKPKSGYVPPTPSANAITDNYHNYYAYGLSRVKSKTQVTFNYSCTGKPLAAKLVLTNSATNEQKEYDIPCNKGSNSYKMPLTDFEPGDWKWGITLVNDPEDDTHEFYSLASMTKGSGVAINNNPSHTYFGYMFFSDCHSSKGFTTVKPDLSALNTTPFLSKQFTGGDCSPGRMAINPANSYVYVADYQPAHSGIYYILPNSTTSITPFYNGTRQSDGRITVGDNTIGGAVSGLAFTGAGDSTSLYAFVHHYPNNGSYNLVRYDIGTDRTVSTQPDKVYTEVSDLMLNRFVNIHPDCDGVWLSQLRYNGNNTAQVPSLVYMKRDGSVTFNSGIQLKSLNGTSNGGMAVNRHRNLLAIANANGNIELYHLSWPAPATPELHHWYTFAGGLGRIYQMAFDYADNLFVSAEEGNKGFALAGINPEVYTEASTIINITATAIQPVTADADNEVSFSVTDGSLTLFGPMSQRAYIYNAAGGRVATLKLQPEGVSKRLAAGIYIVRAGQRTFSIRIK